MVEMSHHGYSLNIPNNLTVEEYRKTMADNEGVFFGAGNKGIDVSFAFYSLDSDWWINVHFFFEFSIENKVIMTK
jgi:hypothetical protein